MSISVGRAREFYVHATAYDFDDRKQVLRTLREKLATEFDTMIYQVHAAAWDEGYRDGHNDGLSDGHPLGNDREPEENPYRKADHDA